MIIKDGLFRGGDDAVVAAEMHKCKQAEQAVVVGIEVAVLVGLVLAVPEALREFAGDS